MDKEEAIKKLNELKPPSNSNNRVDNEAIHIEADGILLECVDPDIKKIYEELEELVRGFWYA